MDSVKKSPLDPVTFENTVCENTYFCPLQTRYTNERFCVMFPISRDAEVIVWRA